MNKANPLKRFSDSLKEVAKNLEKKPREVSKPEYFADKASMREWEIRKLGGFKTLQNTCFPVVKDVVTFAATSLVRSHRDKLDSRYGKEIFLKDEFLSVFREVMKDTPVILHSPVAVPKKSRSDVSRSLVVHFSDTHYGCNIEKNELNQLNEYSWTVAARRTAYLFEQAVNYKPQYRNKTELVILINGDIIAGVIHDQEWAVDLLTTQFSGTLRIFLQGITYAARHFPKVRVVCTPGNHGRAMHKSSKDRATVHKWDSYENMIYVALREALKEYKNVQFEIPEAPYAIVDIQGHKYLVTHGDTVVNVGNPGRNLNMRSINEQINKLNSQLVDGNENFAAVICGHVHVSTVQETDSGTMLLINGSMSGLDGYAQSVGVFTKNATQTIFEAVHDFPVGDIRMIKLRAADKLASLDQIIVPFSGKF